LVSIPIRDLMNLNLPDPIDRSEKLYWFQSLLGI